MRFRPVGLSRLTGQELERRLRTKVFDNQIADDNRILIHHSSNSEEVVSATICVSEENLMFLWLRREGCVADDMAPGTDEGRSTAAISHEELPSKL